VTDAEFRSDKTIAGIVSQVNSGEPFAKADDINSMSLASAALWYVRHGIKVFPCSTRGKRPLTGVGGFKHASSDAETVIAWWKRVPTANIGCPCGRLNGFVVLDFDCKGDHGKTPAQGMVSHDRLVDVQGPFTTLATATPSGGRHYYFKADGENHPTWKDVELGIELRGEGGYVLLPPSFVKYPGGTEGVPPAATVTGAHYVLLADKFSRDAIEVAVDEH
jgi:hypothetical protein